MTEKQPNLDSLFLSALEKESGEPRAKFLDQSCGENSELRGQVNQLLLSHEQAGSFLEKPAPELEATVLPENARSNLAESLEAGLAASFGKEVAVVIGRSDHSVLKTLGQTIDLPRVALRESMEEGDDSIVRPNSAEMPTTNSDSRYQLQGEIARGGMGAIIKGRDTDLGRDLAIKVLLDDHKDKPEVVQRFVEEAQIGGQLQHPGIAPIYELGQFADKRPFFAMKLVKGKTLSAILSEREDANADRGKLLGIFEQMCQTMAYAHSRGVIHRDLKPANIMVGAFGEVQVMDWGLAKVLSVGGVADEKKAHTKLNDVSIIQTLRSVGSDAPGMFGSQGSDTQMGSVMGTPAYMPPEQALGEIDNLDERADVFGLGAILCEILTGQPPYVGTDGNSIYRQVARGKLGECFERLDACEADAELIALTKHCLELEPEDRPRDAGVLAERVSGYLESVENKLRETEMERATQAARADAEAAQADAERHRAEAQSERAEAESARASEESKRRRTSLALAASVLLLVGLGSGGWLYMQNQEAIRQSAELDAQREHATEMQVIAEQRNEQRKAADALRIEAEHEQTVAIAAQQTAEAAEQRGRHLQYATDMQLVDSLLQNSNSSAKQILSRLNAYDPESKEYLDQEQDLRDFEWHYFKNIMDGKSIKLAEFNKRDVQLATTDAGEIVTLDNQAQIQRFDIGTGHAFQRPLDLKQKRQVKRKVLSYDGRMAALAIGDTVQLIDTATGEDIASPLPTHSDIGMVFTRDASMLITIDTIDKRIAWWDTTTGRLVAQKDFQPTHINSVEGQEIVSVSADGLTVAIGCLGGSGSQWSAYRMDPEKDEVIVLQDEIPSNGGSINTVAVTPDGKSIAIGYKISRHLWLIDIVTGQQVAQNAQEHAAPITTIAFNLDGYEMITGSSDGVLKVWKDYREITSPETIALQGHDQQITKAVFAEGAKQVVSTSFDQTTRIWNLKKQTELQAQSIDALASHRSQFSADGQLVVGTNGRNGIKICETTTGQIVRSIYPKGKESVEAVAISPDDRLLANGYGKFIQLWDLESGEQLELPYPSKELSHLRGKGHWVASLAFSPNSNYLAVGHGNFDFHMGSIYESDVWTIDIYDVPSRELIQVLSGHRNAVMSVTFSPDGTLLASASHDRTVRLWDTKTWETVRKLNNPDGFGKPEDVAFSPDSNTLALASHDSNVHLFDPRSGEHLKTLKGHVGYVNSVAFSPNGRTLASGANDGTVRLWNVATGRTITSLSYKSFEPKSLQFSADGRQLLAAGYPNVIWSTLPIERNSPVYLAAYFKRLLDQNSESPFRLEALSGGTRVQEALELLDSEDPRVQVAVLVNRSVKNLDAEQWELGLDNLSKAIELASKDNTKLKTDELSDATLLAMRGLTYQALEQTEKAISDLKRAYGLRQSVGFATLLGDLLMQQWQLENWPEQFVQLGQQNEATGIEMVDGIADGVVESATINGQECQLLRGKDDFVNFVNAYFNVAEEFEITKGIDAQIEVEYWDKGSGKFNICYNKDPRLNLKPQFCPNETRLGNSQTWKKATFTLKNAYLTNLMKGQADFRIKAIETDLHIRRVSFKQELFIDEPWEKLAVAFRLTGDEAAATKLLGEHPEAAVGLGHLYIANGQWQQAIDIYNVNITDETTDTQLLVNRAEAYAGLKQWDQARDDWLRAVKQDPQLSQIAIQTLQNAGRMAESVPLMAEESIRNPENTTRAMKIAAFQVWFGQNDEHTMTSKRMLKFVEDSEAVYDLTRVAKLTCLRPITDTTTKETALALAQRAIEIGGVKPWNQMALGMAQYRSGHYAEADIALNTAVETASGINDNFGQQWVERTSNFYRVLSLLQQDKPEEARTLFTKTEADMHPLPAELQADNAHRDDVIMWLAYKEAKGLLAEKESPVADSEPEEGSPSAENSSP